MMLLSKSLRCFARAVRDNNSVYTSHMTKYCEVTKRGFSSKDTIFPGQHRTGITAKLWQERKKEQDKHIGIEGNEAPSFLVNKAPSDSYTEIHMPFSTDQNLQDQYLSAYGSVRMGRLLEDLDAMAGNIAFKHADDNNPKTRPLTIVTASVDSIHLIKRLHPQRDFVMKGSVTWVGKSSMEIEIRVESKDETTNQTITNVSAVFTMVARDAATGRAAHVNPLVPRTDEEKQRFAVGEANKKRRLEWKENSLMRQPPTADERLILHDLFMETKKAQSSPNHVQMQRTEHESLLLCQPSERNIHGKIFGGYLMRQGFELAVATAFLFSQSQPFFVCLDDIAFMKAVDIGSILKLVSTVVYTTGKYVQVEVVASVINPSEGKSDVTNTFHFTFECPNYQDLQIKKVIPQTYEEGMRYLEGRRRRTSDNWLESRT
eukprot:TRINITY_DN7277_c0_g1_i1.p1 TRINITY_DN7277_c0_g1~~TRINITY_DN7277_c0_g1_i1.p1  ORF type:complete len:431 (+),score=50.36 TRINITY_DN7277_c0_g1_i1:14-1306(+)